MLKLKPSEIRYSQDSISCTFTGQHWGKKIGETLDELVNGKISVDNIPKISVIFKNGKWFTYDNRRLWVFKHLEVLGGPIHISVIQTTYLNMSKFTTNNEGTAIRVRGSPGGSWYYEYYRNPTKYRNHLRNRYFDTYSDPPVQSASSYAEYFRSGLPTSSYQSSLPMQPTNDWRYNTELSSIRNNTEISHAVLDFQQQPTVRYQSTDYTTEMVSSSKSLFSHDQKSQQSLSSITEAQRPISASSVKDTRQGLVLSSSDSTKLALETRKYLVPAAEIAVQPVHKSTPSTFTTGVISSQTVSGRTDTPVPTPESSLRNSRQASTVFGSNSSGTRNYLVPNESGVTLVNQRSRENRTSSSQNETASKNKKSSFVSEPVGSHDRNKTADINRPSCGSSMAAMRTANIKGHTLKTAPTLKPASRQLFSTFITVKQNQCHPRKPVLMMLDISKIRYTKDTIECPLSDERQFAVQGRLRELLQAANPKPMEVYKAYDLYWLKEENDVLWSLLNLMQDRSLLGKTMYKVKVLVTEDNDAFLEFMRKDKPWLQICDILQLGQKIEIIK